MMTEWIWRRYAIEMPGADRTIIEASSPGVAVELYLAGHGMMSYDSLNIEVTDEPPSPTYTKEDAIILLGDRATEYRSVMGLNYHHHVNICPRCGNAFWWGNEERHRAGKEPSND
jgi:hypothetical protein